MTINKKIANEMIMEDKCKYIVYATTENGEGKVSQIGAYEDISEVEIVIGMFSKDVVITIEKEYV
jgi:hypothetical protein